MKILRGIFLALETVLCLFGKIRYDVVFTSTKTIRKSGRTCESFGHTLHCSKRTKASSI